jgi:hypothetical protein
MIALLDQIPSEAKIQKEPRALRFGKHVRCVWCATRNVYMLVIEDTVADGVGSPLPCYPKHGYLERSFTFERSGDLCGVGHRKCRSFKPRNSAK